MSRLRDLAVVAAVVTVAGVAVVQVLRLTMNGAMRALFGAGAR